LNKELKIDKAIYLVDDATRADSFLRRNLGWKRLGPEENEANPKRLNGFRRIFRDGRTKVYRRAWKIA